MALLEKYMNDSPAVNSETPSETLPKGVYPMEVINGKLEAKKGTGKSGTAYAFGDARVQLRATDGPLKGQTTWAPANVTLPDPVKNDGTRMEDSMIAKITYFAQKFCDATGFGKKLDPSWNRSEAPDPKRPGKTLTRFSGKMLTKAALLAIAESEPDREAFEGLLKGLTGIFTLDVDEGGYQVIKGVEPITDANLAGWRSKHAGAGAPAAARPSSIYA